MARQVARQVAGDDWSLWHEDAATEEHERLAQRLRVAIADTTVRQDRDDDQRHGLAWWYPQLKLWPTVRSVGDGRGGGSARLPLNSDAADFLTGRYWCDDTRPMPQARTEREDAELADPANYALGFEPTVLQLELLVRARLGQASPPPRATAANALEPSPAVTAALQYLLHFVPEIADQPQLAEYVLDEAHRLLARARGMLHGARWTAGRGPCQHCHQVDSVISDEERAFCSNPFCRRPNGERRCWLWDGEQNAWQEVSEPDAEGRGQLSDAQLSRWTG